jgi:hypothetical protein
MKRHSVFLQFIFVGLYLTSCVGTRNAGYDPARVQERLTAHVAILAADTMGGRPSGTAFERMAADYIVAEFQRMGLQPVRHPFDVPVGAGDTLHCFNLTALLDRQADSTIVIGAHYDHLGMGGAQSLELRKKGIHPGADDNASGVALLLELARSLVAEKGLRYNYLFVATSAHEIGLWGIQDLVKSPEFRRHQLKCYLNLDMVGRLHTEAHILRFSYCKEFPALRAWEALGKPAGLYIRMDESHETINDYSVVCDAGLPAISLTTGVHDDYHRISDRPDRLNYAGMKLVFDYCRAIVR